MTQLQTSDATRIMRGKTYLPIDVKTWDMIDARKVQVHATTDKKGNPLAGLS